MRAGAYGRFDVCSTGRAGIHTEHTCDSGADNRDQLHLWMACDVFGVYFCPAGGAYIWLRHLVGQLSVCVAAAGSRGRADAENDSALIWAVAAALHGLCFGALCAIPYFFAGGPAMAFSYWVSGVPFDLAHCAGNFVLTLVLYKPLMAGMRKALSL